MRLLALARAPVELAEAEVAVGDEGAHAADSCRTNGLAIVSRAYIHAGVVRLRGDLTKHPQRPRVIRGVLELSASQVRLAAIDQADDRKVMNPV